MLKHVLTMCLKFQRVLLQPGDLPPPGLAATASYILNRSVATCRRRPPTAAAFGSRPRRQPPSAAAACSSRRRRRQRAAAAVVGRRWRPTSAATSIGCLQRLPNCCRPPKAAAFGSRLRRAPAWVAVGDRNGISQLLNIFGFCIELAFPGHFCFRLPWKTKPSFIKSNLRYDLSRLPPKKTYSHIATR